MNFNSTFEELSKLYESVPTEEPLTEGKIIDGLKKVGTRLKADVSTIVRCFAELSGVDALEDLATHVENKAVLKALQSGNETVLNTLTKEDIEELEQDIKDYEEAKKAKKSGVKEQLTEDSAAEKITWELSDNLGPVVKQTFGSKEEALMYANKYKIDNATQLVGTRYINGEYLGNIEHKIKNCGNNDYFEYQIVEACGKNLQEDSDAEIEIVDDEQAGTKVVLECSKCGGILLKDGADVSPDKENPALVNIGEACQYCESEEGFKVLGDFIPVEAKEEDLEEGIFGFKNRKKEVDAQNAAMRKDIHAKNDAAITKALQNTPVLVKLRKDRNDPYVIDYFDSSSAASAARERYTNTETDKKNVVYSVMTAEEAQNRGAVVSLPVKYVDKYR